MRDALCAARTAEVGARDAFLAATTRADQNAACRAAAMTALMADLFGPAA